MGTLRHMEWEMFSGFWGSRRCEKGRPVAEKSFLQLCNWSFTYFISAPQFVGDLDLVVSMRAFVGEDIFRTGMRGMMCSVGSGRTKTF